MSDATEVRVEKHFRHSPERVFDAFMDPARVGDWLFRTPAGTLARCDYDPRPGGRFLIVEEREAGPAHHWGEFVVLERPHRIIFDFWVDEAAEERTRVTVALCASGDGCDLVLTHDLAPEWAAWADRSAAGWSMILASLKGVME